MRITIDFFKQLMLFIKPVCQLFIIQTLKMFQNQNLSNLQASIQTSVFQNQANYTHNFPATMLNFFWGFPLNYSFRTFSVIYAPQNLPPTAQTIQKVPVATPIRRQQSMKTIHANRRNQRHKKRIRNSIKQLQSAKKNSQSNIINHFYSFFSRYQQCQKNIEKIIQRFHKSWADNYKIKNLFYNVLRMISLKRGRRYVNRNNILNFYTPQSLKNQFQDIEEKLLETGLINIEQFCFIFRVITAEFIKNTSVTAILTSRRISSIARNQHLRRRRQISTSFLKESL